MQRKRQRNPELAKKKGQRGGKDKGKGRYHQRAGLGRLRRAHASTRQRSGDWSHLAEDEDDRHGSDDERGSHTGQNLLAKFNRLTRDASAGEGEAAAICGLEGQRIHVRTAEGIEHVCRLRKVLTKMLAGERQPVCVGDAVRFQADPDDEEYAIITALLPRRNQLVRADSHNKALIHVFAANVDHLVIVASAAMPDLKPGLIDRYLTIAHIADIEPIIVLNKADLSPMGGAARLYRDLGYIVFTTIAADDAERPTALGNQLCGKACVFAGQSGVGKSSLVRALYPDTELRIGVVSDAQRKGRHTTTSSRSYRMDDGTTLIDTPGIRECGLPGLTALDIALLYPDIAAHHHQCRFHNCTHLHEPGCAVQAALEAGELHPSRYASYCSIVEEDLAG